MASDLLTLFKSKLPVTGMTCQIGELPDKPDSIIVIRTLPGVSPTVFFGQPDAVEYPLIHIEVRALDYATGYTACNTIKEVFKNYSDADFLGVTMVGSISELGKDINLRRHFSMTFRVILKE